MHRRLLIRPGAIGDVIVSLPALECLRAGFTEVWVPRPLVPLIGFADKVEAIASTGIDLFGIPGIAPLPALAPRLASFDSIISWYGANREEFREALAAACPGEVRFFPALPAEGGEVHAVEFYLGQAGIVAACSGARRPVIPVAGIPAESSYAVIHPYSGSSHKNWPLERFRELAEALSGEIRVEWCAEPGSGLEGAREFENLRDLAGWLAGARLYIGNDSGITHLAAAAGAPVLALFGPTDPAVWGPCSASATILRGAGNRMEAIAVQQVLETARRILAGR